MTTTHTPGPWTLETVRTVSGFCHKVGPFPARREGGDPRHACLYSDYPSESNPADQELLANARLIAAAPELLEALEWALRAMEARNPLWAEGERFVAARATIAKAKGEQQ
ncbi:hypothetical protein ACOTGA_23390 [Achromobacter xylosoxidans]|uniref:hypothetical protein n=1 Tax=Alcaligenes xylosoxydans xylosoxydans TaxID=85698 RepID=UPI0008A33078|nr:hypothetical protein [Achromobacter xylosoxidans]OFL37497.1 hypothetical protein HMPREF2772_27220 [Achromobacter xylosoxidans]